MKYSYLIICNIIFLMCFAESIAQENLQKTCFDCHNELTSNKIIHSPAQESCETCHEATGVEHPSETNGFNLVDKEPNLCYVCHEAQNTKKNVHYPIADGQCVICHSPHSSKYSYLLLKPSSDKLCYECHDNQAPTDKIVHAPIEAGSCEDCHNPHQSDNSLFLKKKSPKLCMECHSYLAEEKKVVHYPFDEDCLNCHKSHNSKEKSLLIDKTPGLCYNCHDDVGTKKNVHKPVKDGDCSSCHSPHASNNNVLLLKPENNLCIDCHKRPYISDSGETENITNKLIEGNTIHAPVEDACANCHKPHTSDYHSLLSNNFPEGAYSLASVENYALCFDCHDSEMLIVENTTTATNFRHGDKNMHVLHLKGEKGRTCKMCHDVHGAKNLFIISEKVPFGNWEMDMNFKVFENGGSCATGCHAEKTYDRTSGLEKIDSLGSEGQINIKTQKKYQNYTENIHEIDSAVIKLNAMLEEKYQQEKDSLRATKLIAENKQDSLLTNEAPDTVLEIADADISAVVPIEEQHIETTTDTIGDDLISQIVSPPQKDSILEDTKQDSLIAESINLQAKEKDSEVETKELHEEESISEGTEHVQQNLAKEEKLLDNNELKTIKQFPNILFDFSKTTISPFGIENIQKLTNYLLDNQTLIVKIVGHTDSIGSVEYNQYLSLQRANSVKSLIIDSGVNKNRIYVLGRGESEPSSSNSNSKGRSLNRRVEFIIMNEE
jgi:predicted CXXCH cytochrome family protein